MSTSTTYDIESLGRTVCYNRRMISLPETYTILAVETSCDETAAAVIRGGREIIANVVASQIDEHRRYGGIVPEVASRQHMLAIMPVVREALAVLPGGWNDVDAIAATYGPGLSGALMTGLNTAKSMAWARKLPFIGINHIEAHIYANWLIASSDSTTMNENMPGQLNPPSFPIVALVVSGGHTLLALMEGHGCYKLLGQTRDDAAGEAFDKAARLMGLGFPGGPAIQKAAEQASGGVVLPRAWLRDSYDFSFSGLKTAVLHHVRERTEREQRNAQPARRKHEIEHAAQPEAAAKPIPATPANERFMTQLAFAFQESVVDVLVSKAITAAQAFKATEIVLAGGVAANARLREELVRRSTVPVRFPPIALCTDNAAMIAAAAYYRSSDMLQAGWGLDVAPNLKLA